MSSDNVSARSDFGLVVVRGLWALVTSVVLLAQIPILRASFVAVHHTCAEPECQAGQLTIQAARTIAALHLPLEAFALWDDILLLASIVVFSLVGGLIIWRRSQDRMGILTGFTLVLFGGVTLVFGSQSDILQLEGPVAGPIVNVLYLAGEIGIGLVLFLFPDGRFVPRWIAGLGALWVLMQLPPYLTPGSPLDYNNGSTVAGISWVVLLLSMVATQIYRYRAVSDATERQQTKWVVLGTAVALVSFLVALVLGGVVPLVSHVGPLFLLYQSLFRLLMLPIPIGIGFAMLRYRLWDVDVLINRALVYASLTLSIVGLYIGGVIGLQALFRTVTSQNSDLAVAIATLAIAALFNPWRRRLQAFIDRRFYRRRYDAARILAAFSGRLRDQVDLDSLTHDLVAVAQETMHPAHVALWLRGGIE